MIVNNIRYCVAGVADEYGRKDTISIQPVKGRDDAVLIITNASGITILVSDLQKGIEDAINKADG